MQPQHLPPVEIHMDENTIVITDPHTGAIRTIDPNDANFQKHHAALIGIWQTVYQN